MVISVASGKGGTGKTLVATSLALSLQDQDSVQLLDCDVEEPNDYIFLKPSFTRREAVVMLAPKVDEKKCTYCGKCAQACHWNAMAVVKEKVLIFPELCHGCGVCAYVCPEDAISEEEREIGVVDLGQSGGVQFAQGTLAVGEPLSPAVIRKVKEYGDRKGIVIIDASPGTSCPVVEAIRDSDFCLLVTEPTPFGLSDLCLAVEVVRKLEIPCGVVINRVGVGDEGVESYCHEQGIPILLKIPLDRRIATLYSKGIPLVEGMPEWREVFSKLFRDIKEMSVGGQVAK
jgi:MinD superfamily P-loop ATPase